MSTTPALLAAAGGVGFGHAVLPDHWVPLAVVGRTQRYPLGKVARLSGLAGVAHVLVSVILGGVIILVGLPLRDAVQHAQDTLIGTVLILTGVAFMALEVTGHGHHHHGADDHHDHHHHHHAGSGGHHHHPPAAGSRFGRLAAVMVPFGAAASPDLTILPVFLAATAAGAGTAVASLLVFAAITIITFVTLTLVATAGGYQVRGAWLDRWGNVFTAVVLIVIGTLVLAGVL
jgi:nickel/cobalt transporter (NicO) family protein